MDAGYGVGMEFLSSNTQEALTKKVDELLRSETASRLIRIQGVPEGGEGGHRALWGIREQFLLTEGLLEKLAQTFLDENHWV